MAKITLYSTQPFPKVHSLQAYLLQVGVVLVAGAGLALAAGKCENGQKSGFSVDVNNFLRLLDRKVKDKGPT